MAQIKGVCKNIDDCSKAEDREAQMVEKSAPFVCGECEKPLVQMKQKTKSKQPMIIGVVVGVLVLVGTGVGFYFPTGDGGVTGGVTVDDTVATPKVDTVAVPEEITDIDSLVAADTLAIDTVVIDTITTKPVELDGVHDLEYATWSGKLNKGKPHDNAQMTFKKRHLIESRDSKSRYAAAGDYIIGTYKNGHLIHGRWYKKDGNIETITIGESASDDE